MLLRETDQRLNLLPRLAECFLDGREAARTEHSVEEMLAQRIYGLGAGLRRPERPRAVAARCPDGVLVGRKEVERPLAGKSTLNRLELGTGMKDRHKKITFWKEAIDEIRSKEADFPRRGQEEKHDGGSPHPCGERVWSFVHFCTTWPRWPCHLDVARASSPWGSTLRCSTVGPEGPHSQTHRFSPHWPCYNST